VFYMYVHVLSVFHLNFVFRGLLILQILLAVKNVKLKGIQIPVCLIYS
jgi:hypothetical protein